MLTFKSSIEMYMQCVCVHFHKGRVSIELLKILFNKQKKKKKHRATHT